MELTNRKIKMLRETLIVTRSVIILIVMILITPIVLTAAIISNFVYKLFFRKKKSIRGEVALITGSSRGLGKEIAIKLAAEGCHIAVVATNLNKAKETAKEISETYNVKAKAFETDVTDFEKVQALSKEVEEHLGPVTILVNNAGLMSSKFPDNLTKNEIQNMIDTNLTAHIWTIRTFTKRMMELKKGHIVAISSIAGILPATHLEYSATKCGIRGLMNALTGILIATECNFIKTTAVFPYFLSTNEEVKNLAQSIKMDSFYPIIPGDKAAQEIVEGILTNEKEIIIPKIAGIFYRLLELFPRDFVSFVLFGNNKISMTKLG